MASMVRKDASVGTAFGQKLKEPLTFSFEYEELAAGDTIPEAEVLTAEDILGYVNQRRYAASRAKAQNEVFEANGISKPKLLDTEDGRLAGMVKILVAAGNTVENATAMAKQVLGIA